jgi:hypothetical protein
MDCERAVKPSDGNVACVLCGAMPDEDCPLSDLSAEWAAPVVPKTTFIGGDSSGEDGVCESCQ